MLLLIVSINKPICYYRPSVHDQQGMVLPKSWTIAATLILIEKNEEGQVASSDRKFPTSQLADGNSPTDNLLVKVTRMIVVQYLFPVYYQNYAVFFRCNILIISVHYKNCVYTPKQFYFKNI